MPTYLQCEKRLSSCLSSNQENLLIWVGLIVLSLFSALQQRCSSICYFLLLPMPYQKSSSQHGFAPKHFCTTALLPIVTRIAIGFNDPKPARHTAVCALDISKAFDSINHTLLIEQIGATSLHSNIVRWLSAYIRGRTARCTYNSALSQPMILRSGVPQGSVL
jgi:hypothetical protein